MQEGKDSRREEGKERERREEGIGEWEGTERMLMYYSEIMG